MKANSKIRSIIILALGLLSCSAMKNTAKSPSERLVIAIQNGENFKSVGETFDSDLILDLLFPDPSSHSFYIKSELVFEKCKFKGKINLKPQAGRKIYFSKEIIFEGCEFEKQFKINDAVFNARFQMGANLFRQSLDLQRNSYNNICRVDENEIGQDLIQQYSNFHENLSLFGNTIGRHLLLQGTSVQGKAQLGNTSLFGSIDISNCHFHEDFNMDYAKNGQKLLAGNSKFFGRCYIKEIADFKSADLSSSEIFGKYLFSAKHDLTPEMTDTVILIDGE